MANRNILTLETEVVDLDGYVALTNDGYANVISTRPTTPGANLAGPWTRLLGVQNSITGTNGATQVQPHTSTGVYTFVLDHPYFCLLGAEAIGVDATGTQLVSHPAKANVTANQTGSTLGQFPGTDPAVAPQTIVFEFRTSTGTLTDPAGAFWVHIRLKRSGNV